jgi:hypothetical protein
MLDEKGFASAELIFVTLIVIVIIGGLVNFISTETNQSQTGNMGQARVTGENIAEVVNTVYTNGPGYTINLTIPATLTAIVTGSTHSVTVIYKGQSIIVNLIPTNINDTTLTNGTYNVKNNNGTIEFSNQTSS